jgi:hypothetical protein
MFGSAIWGLVSGDPYKMVQPYDHAKRICGFDDDVKDYPALYFTEFAPDYSDQYGMDGKSDLVRKIFYENAICVKICPT